MNRKRIFQETERRGLTLVELLVVIIIIGLIASMFMLAYRGASQESMALKTRSTIQKISEVLNSRLDEYASFPVMLREAATGLPLSSSGVAMSSSDSPTMLRERARLLALRDLIRMEMPDHPDDLKYTTFWHGVYSNSATFIDDLGGNLPRPIATGLMNPINAAPLYVQNTMSARTRSLMTRLTRDGAPIPQWDRFNANAELLYLIVEDTEMFGSSAIELFGKTEIGDTDGDSLMEFLDAFGRPIQWIRWPAGLANAGRYNPDMLNPAAVDTANMRLVVNSESFDRLGTDPGWGTSLPPGVGMAPLVVSSGPDRAFGIRFRKAARYESPASAPDAVGTFVGQSTCSSADIEWSLPLYGASVTVIFTDPWYPRLPADAAKRMGARLIQGSDLPEDNGMQANPAFANDNISNYDGTAVAL